MNREEFLQILKEQLLGELEDMQVTSHVRYYDQYIGNQVAMGHTEEEVIESLGDPRLIAKTLIDTAGTSTEAHGTYEQESYETESGGGGGEARKTGWPDLSTWYGKVLVILIAAGIIILVVTLLSALLPFLLIIFCVSMLARYFRGRR